MKNRRLYLNIIGYCIVLVSLLGAIGYLNTELIDELTTLAILVITSYYVRLGIWYYMCSLALGIVLDSSVDPYHLTSREFSWIIGSTILLAIYYIYKQFRITTITTNEYEQFTTYINTENENRKS